MRRLPEPLTLTWRSILIGFLGVLIVAGFTPYNDYVLQNSPFIGNHFPIGIFTLVAALILLLNPLLILFKKHPLSTGELVVIMTMMLFAAAVPSSGLLRYFEPSVLSPFWIARDFAWLKPIANLMPNILTPSKDPSSPIITNYMLGLDPVSGDSTPILAFVMPFALWLILIAAVLGAAFFLAAIFRKQWVHHERLTFPLATIPLELMATPELGRWYNKLWRNPLLWIGAGIPLFIYLLAGLHDKYPSLPIIDLKYDIHSSFTERPWDALPTYITTNRLYFAAVGICFFIPSEIAFSLWLFLILNGLARVVFSQTSIDPAVNEPVRGMGTYLGYFAGLVWLARNHLKLVFASAWRNAPRDESEPLSYRTMVVGLLVCTLAAFIWLWLAGMNPILAFLLLAIGFILVTLMARIVAETGLFFVGPMWWPNQFIAALIGPHLVNTISFYWTQIISHIFFADLRETLMPFAANSLRMGQELPSKVRPKWIRLLAIALLASTLIAAGMHHYLSYSHGRTALADDWATKQIPFRAMQETYTFESTAPQTTLASGWANFTLGAGMVLFLMVGRVLWVAWPFHPIGLLLMNSWSCQVVWFSVLIGWIIKRLLLRYGGAGAFRRARPFFIGLLVGEFLAAGLWLLIALLTHGYLHYSFLP